MTISSPADLERLLLSAITVVLRRDMSLNRRLYVWLLGPESQPSYFPKYALTPLTKALKKLLHKTGNLPPHPIRVTKISLALLDKWEVGGHIVPELFTPIMETVFSKPDSAILSSARALFDSMDPAVIWAELFSWIDLGKVVMLIWVVDKFNLREEEMLVKHIPQVLLHILCLLRHHLVQGTQWFVLCQKLIQLLPSRAFTSSKGIELGSDFADVDVTTFVREYYRKISGKAGVDVSLPESIKGTYFHRHLLNIFRSVGEPTSENVPDYTLEWIVLLKVTGGIVPPLPEFNLAPVLGNLRPYIYKRDNFQLLGTVIDTTITLVNRRHIHKDVFQLSPDESTEHSSLATTLVQLLWRNLDPNKAANHVESVAYIWSLMSLLPAAVVEMQLADQIIGSTVTEDGKAQACARFSVLWKHAVDKSGTAAVLTKAMMLILRFLKGEEGSLGRTGVERWLAGLGNSAHRYKPPGSRLILECLILYFPSSWKINSSDYPYRKITKTLQC